MSEKTLLINNEFEYLPETKAIQNLEIYPNITQREASYKILRWLTDDFLKKLLDAGLTKQKIQESHPKIMGPDSTLAGHTLNIAMAGARLGLNYDDRLAFENHDAEESFLIDHRISDYETGTKTKAIKKLEKERTRWLFERVDITGVRLDKMIKTIEKKGPSGRMLKFEEYKSFLLQADYFQQWIWNYSQTPEPSPIMSMYIEEMKYLRKDIKANLRKLKF
jgi:hypothetical protein